MKVVARAPGKALLFGEYAVLEGAPALVAALGVRAEARFDSSAVADLWHLAVPQLELATTLVRQGESVVPAAKVPAPLQLTASLLAAAARAGDLPPGHLALDTRAFFCGRNKLGLGSSAAVAVATWYALRAACGSVPADDGLDEVTALHRQAQHGTGSGVDVAASFLGGVVRYQLPHLPGSHGAVARRAVRVAKQDTAVLVLIYTGHAVATAPFLQALARLKEKDAGRYWACLEPLAQLSAAACELWALGHTQGLLPLVDAYAAAMEALGAAMDMPVVSREHHAAAAVVRRQGAAYKPSGAGGGDVGLAFCADVQQAKKVVRALGRRGLLHLPHAISATGVCVQRSEA